MQAFMRKPIPDPDGAIKTAVCAWLVDDIPADEAMRRITRTLSGQRQPLPIRAQVTRPSERTPWN